MLTSQAKGYTNFCKAFDRLFSLATRIWLLEVIRCEGKPTTSQMSNCLPIPPRPKVGALFQGRFTIAGSPRWSHKSLLERTQCCPNTPVTLHPQRDKLRSDCQSLSL
jgi:hypothetical protein